MKKLITSLALFAACLCLNAQTFGTKTITYTTNYLTITGSTNAPFSYNGQSLTNTCYFPVPPASVYLKGVSSTNEVFIGSYYVQFPGSTNLILLGSITNSFASGTNDGTWTTNIPATGGSIGFPIIMQANIGNFINQIYVQ